MSFPIQTDGLKLIKEKLRFAEKKVPVGHRRLTKNDCSVGLDFFQVLPFFIFDIFVCASSTSVRERRRQSSRYPHRYHGEIYR